MSIRTAAATAARALEAGGEPPRARSRQERARANARREILEAAAGVFARRGYAAATLSELAQAAGYAAPSLYRYFSGKEEIFRSLVALLRADLEATFEARVRGGESLAGRLESLLTTQIELARRRREIFALLASTPPDGLGLDPPLHDLRAGASLYERWLTAWMRKHVPARELRCPLGQASRALAGAAHAFHHASVLGPTSGLDPAAEARLVVDLALHGIAATPAPGPSGRRGAST